MRPRGLRPPANRAGQPTGRGGQPRRSARTLHNWRARNHLPAHAVVTIATAYDQHPVHALIELGHLAPEHACPVDPGTVLRTTPTPTLLAEIQRRIPHP